ncbi:MAG TPA: hypothetical protein VMI15_01925, partial [Burkholderiales bacterium]|nr:hypothetical protein [Burkholderiales bacterium]
GFRGTRGNGLRPPALLQPGLRGRAPAPFEDPPMHAMLTVALIDVIVVAGALLAVLVDGLRSRKR